MLAVIRKIREMGYDLVPRAPSASSASDSEDERQAPASPIEAATPNISPHLAKYMWDCGNLVLKYEGMTIKLPARAFLEEDTDVRFDKCKHCRVVSKYKATCYSGEGANDAWTVTLCGRPCCSWRRVHLANKAASGIRATLTDPREQPDPLDMRYVRRSAGPRAAAPLLWGASAGSLAY